MNSVSVGMRDSYGIFQEQWRGLRCLMQTSSRTSLAGFNPPIDTGDGGATIFSLTDSDVGREGSDYSAQFRHSLIPIISYGESTTSGIQLGPTDYKSQQ